VRTSPTYKTIMNPNWDTSPRKGADIAQKTKVLREGHRRLEPKKAYAAWTRARRTGRRCLGSSVGRTSTSSWSDSISVLSKAQATKFWVPACWQRSLDKVVSSCRRRSTSGGAAVGVD